MGENIDKLLESIGEKVLTIVDKLLDKAVVKVEDEEFVEKAGKWIKTNVDITIDEVNIIDKKEE